MPLSPEDIESKRFVPEIRGYDRNEVDAFLREVAAEFRELQQRFREVVEAAEVPEGGDRFENMGDHVAAMLRLAEEQANEIRAAARKEADERLAAATAQAARVENAAKAELERGQTFRETAERRADDVAPRHLRRRSLRRFLGR